MPYQDFNIVISAQQGSEYLVAAVAEEQGRVSDTLPPPDSQLRTQLARIAGLHATGDNDGLGLMRDTGSALFRWLLPPAIESHLRITWDRARRQGQGLRLRLTIDAPELAAWPWELLHDPARDHTFAISPNTLLVRYFDQAAAFGGPADQRADLPLDLLLVLPAAPDLDLERERLSVEAVATAMPGALRVHALQGVVTRLDLADALLQGDYDMVHFSGHGAFIDGRGYVALNKPDGAQDWVHSGALARLAVNHGSIKLVVLNVCSSGQTDETRAFQGLAPQMVRYGVPAVVAMQFPITDDAATTFSREFYKRLCTGADAGQVDVAITYARSMLAVLHPDEISWAAPVVYTHAPDGVIYHLPRNEHGTQVLNLGAQRARLAALDASLQTSRGLAEDWLLADSSALLRWRQTLRRTEEAYRAYTAGPDIEARQVAQAGLTLTQERLASLEQALAAALSPAA